MKRFKTIVAIFVCMFMISMFCIHTNTDAQTNQCAQVQTQTVSKVAPKKAIVKEKHKKKKKKKTKKYLGKFRITAYSYSEGYGENFRTASGKKPRPYYTVAVDPRVIPLGTKLYIKGIGVVQAQDTGGAVKGKVIDVHIGYGNCNKFGVKHLKVYKILRK